MMNYKQFYDRISGPLRPYARVLGGLNKAITRTFYLLFPIFISLVWLRNGWFVLFMTVLIMGGGFFLLSLGRSFYNRPRPYQTWDIQPLIKKDSLGKSFPSRHVFSATVIAMLALTLNPWLGGTMLFLAMALAFLRVLGGVHYPSDVLAGYVIGILVGLLLYL
ncbi:phosphatase PAP2 family protein [Streptococcus vestibularis]|nr:phosphatase PAP2 family protein [Streptococcus vestibularis]